MMNFKTLVRCQLMMVAFLSFLQPATAQSHKKSKKDSSTVEMGISYISDNINGGRRDTFRTAYFSTSLGYYTKSGFYISGALSYLSAESRVDMFQLEGGYQFKKRKWSGGLYVCRYFYNANSYNISSEISGIAGADLEYTNNFLTPSLSSHLNIAQVPDIGFSFGLKKSYYVFDEQVEINPSLYINAGTQNFYNAYYENRRYSVDRKTKKASGVSGSALGVDQIRVTDVELAVPVYYAFKKLQFTFSPTFVIPISPTTIQVTDETNYTSPYTYEENLQSTFYWSLGVSYRFKVKGH